VRCVTTTATTATAQLSQLSDNDFDDLAELLEAHSRFDTDGLLGVLHAVAVAPSLMPPSAWLPEVLPDGPGDSPQLVGLLLRLYNQVLQAVDRRHPLVPEKEDIDGCESFAAGYAAAAALDPLWIGHDDRWTFASCLAYLGGRRDLVPNHTFAKLEAVPDAKETLRRDLDAVIAATHESFLKVRRAAFEPHVHAPVLRRTARVGRNEPCPCGSGKKFKRCCIDRTDHSAR
jgi:uncharacterized protein